MIRALLSAILFIILDFIVLPAVGFFNGSLLSLFMISLILYYGVQEKPIILGLGLAVLTEFSLGYKLGAYSVSFLILCILILFISKFFNIPTIKTSRGVNTIFMLSLAGPFLYYGFIVIFNLINTRNFIVPAHAADFVYLAYYFLGIFLLLNFLKYVQKGI